PPRIGALEQVHREAVGRDADAVAHAGHRRKRVERAAGHRARDAGYAAERPHEQLYLALELGHVAVALVPGVLERGDARELHERRYARERRVGELAEHVDDRGVRDREPEPPPAHAE